MFETNIYQSRDVLPDSVDADLVYTGVLHIMYEQFQLDNNFKIYLEGTLQSDHVLRTGIKPTTYPKLFEVVCGTESRVVDFAGANK